MGELIKIINTRVVGVSYENADGSSRQEILSGCVEGENVYLKYFEYNGLPAYAVFDSLDNQIGNLSQDLANDIYAQYRDCYFDAQIERITGGGEDMHYGCVINIEIYDSEPVAMEPAATAPQNAPQIKNDSVFGVIGLFFRFLFELAKLLFWLGFIIAIIAFVVAIL